MKPSTKRRHENRAIVREARALPEARDHLGRPLDRRYAVEPYHRGGLKAAVLREDREGNEVTVKAAEQPSPWGYRVRCKVGRADSPREPVGKGAKAKAPRKAKARVTRQATPDVPTQYVVPPIPIPTPEAVAARSRARKEK